VNDRRRPRAPAKPKPSPQLTGPVQLDDETRNALILFNARLVAQEELEREKRRVDKATKAKDEAAATVRRLEGDPKATAEQKNEAQAAYLAALEALDRAKSGEPAAGDATDTDDSDADADAADGDAADDDGDAPTAAESADDETTTSDGEPAATTDDEPAVATEEEPAVATEEEPAATTDDEPAVATEEEPAATTDDEPATANEEEPAASE
jgi:hypothetical protein